MTELLDSSELPEQPEGRVTVGAALRYATLVWITSVLLSPVLLSFVTMIMDGNGSFNGFLGIVFLFVLYGGGLSIPNWLLFFGGVVFLTRQFRQTQHIRWGAQAWAAFLTVALFFILFGSENPSFLSNEGWIFPGAYLLTLSVGIWYYPIRRG
jgi:hypothetical protein